MSDLKTLIEQIVDERVLSILASLEIPDGRLILTEERLAQLLLRGTASPISEPKSSGRGARKLQKHVASAAGASDPASAVHATEHSIEHAPPEDLSYAV